MPPPCGWKTDADPIPRLSPHRSSTPSRTSLPEPQACLPAIAIISFLTRCDPHAPASLARRFCAMHRVPRRWKTSDGRPNRSALPSLSFPWLSPGWLITTGHRNVRQGDGLSWDYEEDAPLTPHSSSAIVSRLSTGVYCDVFPCLAHGTGF